MQRVGVCLALGALALATPALAQEPASEEAKVKLQMGSGLGDDDDLLDPDLDGGEAAPAPQVPEPPLAEKTRIDNEAVEIGRDADRFGDELRELVRKLRQNQPGARDEVENRLAEAKKQLSGLNSQVAAIEKDLEAKEGRKRSRERGTYGTELDLKRLPGRSRRPQRGDAQFTWWQDLTRKTTAGVQGGLLELAGCRANVLKARADKLTLSTARPHRAYADLGVQDAVGTSRFAQRIYDPRLDDLMLGKKPLAKVAPAKKPVRRSEPTINPAYLQSSEPVVLLPRTRHPVTGRLVPMVNMPLGGVFQAGQQATSIETLSPSAPGQPAQPPLPPANPSGAIKPIR